VALVGSDDETVALGESEKGLPVLEFQYPAGGIHRRAGIDELDAAPVERLEGHAVVQEQGLRAREQRGALVDLIERVGADDARLASGRVDYRLAEGKQRLASAVYRQHLSDRIQRGQGIAAHGPSRDCLAQLGGARRTG